MVGMGDGGWERGRSVGTLLNRAAVGWAVSRSAFGLFIFFSFVGEQTQTSTRPIVITG